MTRPAFSARIVSICRETETIRANTVIFHFIYLLKQQGCGTPAVLVEMRGIEPLSESTLTKTSPGADGILHSLTKAHAVMLIGSVAS